MDITAYAPPKDTTPIVEASADNPLGGLANLGDFLKLFVAQMSHQDPLNPSDGTEFFSQTAQITMVEQLLQMNQANKTSQETLEGVDRSLTATYLGKYVTGAVADETGALSQVSGVVTDILYDSDGKITLGLLDGQAMKLSDVVHVSIITEDPNQG